MVAALQIIRHGITISVFRFIVPTLFPSHWTRFFALIVKIICVRKSRKIRYFAVRLSFFSVPVSFLSRSFANSIRANANTRNDTSFSRGFLFVLLLIAYWYKYYGHRIHNTHGNDYGQEC